MMFKEMTEDVKRRLVFYLLYKYFFRPIFLHKSLPIDLIKINLYDPICTFVFKFKVRRCS